MPEMLKEDVYEEAFTAYDKDGSGFITRWEMTDYLRQCLKDMNSVDKEE